MKETINDRELIMLDGLGVAIRGTYHKPLDDGLESGLPLQSVTRNRIGILFLNGLYATRAANGDAAVYWASSLAERGYPSFRIDLPGYGDSDGDPPADWLGYINIGGYAPVTAAIMKELVARFQLAGIVIVGHCAGAVSAIYAAAASKECKGLVAIDPYFHLPQATTPKVRQRLNLWARQSRFGGILSHLFDIVKQIRLFLHRNAPPANANFSLLRCWKEMASTGLPILVLKAPSRRAPGAKARVGEFDYLKHALELAGRRCRAVVRVMDGANHSFSNEVGRAAVEQQTAIWLNANFPLVRIDEAATATSHSEIEETRADSIGHEQCVHG